MDHNVWAITACIQFADGGLVNKSRPFSTYNVEASTAENAVEKLKTMFNCCNVAVYGKPTKSVVTHEEYENGK